MKEESLAKKSVKDKEALNEKEMIQNIIQKYTNNLQKKDPKQHPQLRYR